MDIHERGIRKRDLSFRRGKGKEVEKPPDKGASLLQKPTERDRKKSSYSLFLLKGGKKRPDKNPQGYRRILYRRALMSFYHFCAKGGGDLIPEGTAEEGGSLSSRRDQPASWTYGGTLAGVGGREEKKSKQRRE